MKILNSRTPGEWQIRIPAPPPPPSAGNALVSLGEDRALAEAMRAASDVIRCNNLVVLSGLGTSLCVQPAAPGYSKAPTMGDLWRQVAQKQDESKQTTSSGLNFLQILQIVGYTVGMDDIEALLSRCRLAESFLAGVQKEEIVKFIALAEDVIITATNFVVMNHPLPVHGEFLRRIARRSQRKSRTKVFTTNYDRCFEEAGRQGRYVIVDGFSHTFPPTFDAIHFTYETARRVASTEPLDPIPNLFHLYKLHGSVDWRRQEPSGEVTKWMQSGKPVLIYPRNSKYELAFEQPYLEMISAFQTALREPDTGLLVIGFGFNDNHLAEPIMSVIRSNLSMKVVIVSPGLAPWKSGDQQGPGECGVNKHLMRLRDLVNAGDARITLLNCSFEEMVPLIPDLAAETDLELHMDRLRRVGAA